MAEIFDFINLDQFGEALAGKSDVGHVHAAYQTQAQTDGRYYQKAEVDGALAAKSDATHLHDDRYYQKGEIDTALAGKADAGVVPALTALSDVTVTAPLDGQVPKWDAGTGTFVWSFEVAAVADGSVNLGGDAVTSSERIFSITAPAAEWYYQPYYVGLAALVNGGLVGNNVGSVIGSDGLLAFVETDDGRISGFVDMNANTFRMFGTIEATTLRENGANLSARYLGINANAVSASKLATARTIALSGDASGSAAFDGSGNITIAVTVANDSHSHAFANVTGKPTTLAGYGITDAAAAGHGHTFASLSAKPTTLAGYGITDAANVSHTHAWSAITDKPATFAPSAHMHEIEDVNGLAAALASLGAVGRVLVTAAHTATKEQVVAVDSTAGAITVTAPADPDANDFFKVADVGANASTNTITVDFGAATFNGAAEDFLIDIDSFAAGFIYTGTTWRLLL